MFRFFANATAGIVNQVGEENMDMLITAGFIVSVTAAIYLCEQLPAWLAGPPPVMPENTEKQQRPM